MGKFSSSYSESVIIYDSETNIDVAKLTKYVNDSGEVTYVVTVDWEAYDNSGIWDDIPGYDMSLRLPEYVRHNSIVFMTEYMPPKSREDSYELMLSVGLDMPYDMWAFMIEQGRVCMDGWRVRRIPGETYEHDAYRVSK